MMFNTKYGNFMKRTYGGESVMARKSTSLKYQVLKDGLKLKTGR
jgi:hypothetical protein